MLIRRIAGCTQTIGKDQGYNGLPIRQRDVVSVIGGLEYQLTATECAFEPTPDELTRLNKGESVIIQLLLFGSPWPPIQVYVDEGAGPIEDDSLASKLRAARDMILLHLSGHHKPVDELNEAIQILEGLLHDLKID